MNLTGGRPTETIEKPKRVDIIGLRGNHRESEGEEAQLAVPLDWMMLCSSQVNIMQTDRKNQ